MISFVCLICLLTGSVQWGFLQNFEKMIYNYSVILKPSCSSSVFVREFKQITTAGAVTAAVTEKVWGEYVSISQMGY